MTLSCVDDWDDDAGGTGSKTLSADESLIVRLCLPDTLSFDDVDIIAQRSASGPALKLWPASTQSVRHHTAKDRVLRLGVAASELFKSRFAWRTVKIVATQRPAAGVAPVRLGSLRVVPRAQAIVTRGVLYAALAALPFCIGSETIVHPNVRALETAVLFACSVVGLGDIWSSVFAALLDHWGRMLSLLAAAYAVALFGLVHVNNQTEAAIQIDGVVVGPHQVLLAWRPEVYRILDASKPAGKDESGGASETYCTRTSDERFYALEAANDDGGSTPRRYCVSERGWRTREVTIRCAAPEAWQGLNSSTSMTQQCTPSRGDAFEKRGLDTSQIFDDAPPVSSPGACWQPSFRIAARDYAQGKRFSGRWITVDVLPGHSVSWSAAEGAQSGVLNSRVAFDNCQATAPSSPAYLWLPKGVATLRIENPRGRSGSLTCPMDCGSSRAHVQAAYVPADGRDTGNDEFQGVGSYELVGTSLWNAHPAGVEAFICTCEGAPVSSDNPLPTATLTLTRPPSAGFRLLFTSSQLPPRLEIVTGASLRSALMCTRPSSNRSDRAVAVQPVVLDKGSVLDRLTFSEVETATPISSDWIRLEGEGATPWSCRAQATGQTTMRPSTPVGFEYRLGSTEDRLRALPKAPCDIDESCHVTAHASNWSATRLTDADKRWCASRRSSWLSEIQRCGALLHGASK